VKSTDRDRLQAGIYWRHGERPAGSFRLVLLDVTPSAAPGEAREALAAVMALLEALPRGEVRDLAGQTERTAAESAMQFSTLRALVAIGRRLFDVEQHDPVLVSVPRPDFLTYLPSLGEAFPALPWANTRAGSIRGEADLLVQLTADNEAAVNVAAVEIWKLIADRGLPLAIVTSFAGFGRPDGRGWLDFHDGVSNLQTDDRQVALEAGADPPWMAGGTYLAFLRLAVDLGVWRSLTRAEQELLVGRDKLSGAPLIGVRRGASGEVLPVAAEAPVERGAKLSPEHVDPPQVTDPVIEASHVHRANQNRASGSTPGGLRVFRQGYDFLDGLGPGGPSLGLTFVSFQRDLSILQHLLHLQGWLGDVNFGGRLDPEDGEPAPVEFISVVSGGLYAVPPRAQPFAGADVFAV
jgi:Dyp-type peroxidase family